jgi:hypothetical protein
MLLNMDDRKIQVKDARYSDQMLLDQCLQRIRALLPIQNPMPFFVHNNPLQYWEQFSFDSGIEQACLLYERAGVLSSRSFIREFEDLVIPIISAYLDQGLNRWPLKKNQGLWLWFCDYIEETFEIKSKCLHQLKVNLNSYRELGGQQTLINLLKSKIPNHNDWFEYLQNLTFHFKGWSGIINVLENNTELYPLEKKQVALIDWVALLATVENSFVGPNFYTDVTHKLHQNLIFKTRLNKIKKNETLYYNDFKNQLEAHFKKNIKNQEQLKTLESQKLFDTQVFFCLDDREESLRRCLEEQNPKIETFGTLGFFGIDVKLKLHGHVLYQPHCPPVIRPRKIAEEKEVSSESSKEYSKMHFFSTGLNHTRFTFYEPLLSLITPLIYFVSLLFRSINPLIYTKFKKYLHLEKKKKQFTYEFLPNESYTDLEKAKIVYDILKSAGLFNRFSKLVVMMAHGSTTSNNPFQKSYGCGACGGQTGYPNSKIFCEFANDLNVRLILCNQGYPIPDSTLFVAALHDTCSDEIFIDDESIQDSEYLDKIKNLKNDFQIALQKNTESRFKIFNISPKDNPKSRSLDWSQVRPEYGHSTVALSIFAPRQLTRSLDLNRRAFLISYDPTIDSDGSLLEYVILNALPVCANINLDYFTSKGFPEAFGSGSKLPMNIVSGIGLMTGSKSDLCIGLARQMVDQHQELRLLSFVYCTKEHLNNVIAKSQRLRNIINHNWIHLVRIDPIQNTFEPITKEITNVF